MDKTIREIFDSLKSIKSFFNDHDAKGVLWDLRITAAYSIFRAFNKHRFLLKPVEPHIILADLMKVNKYLVTSLNTYSKIKAIEVAESAISEPQREDERMQYLYGIAWSQLSKHEYFEAAGLLSQRLINSNMSVDFLNGASCLDMATGIARYALAMVQLGASKVIGVDYSKDCLKEAHCRLNGLDEKKKIELQHADLYKLPASFDANFDFVCANGVIHHLPDPKGALETMGRCTKKGGNAFLSVFSKNEAPWWSAIELMREIVNPAPISYAQSVLESFEAPGSQRFNMLDYSYTPIQHKFEKEWVEETLREAGFSEVNHLEGGVIHDSVLRCKLFDNDKLIYGVSEIRYLLKK